MSLRVLICGGRTFDNAKLVNRVMREHEENVACVIEGGARGADYLGKIWAEKRGIPVFECRANWLRYGKRAGPVRNQWMIDHGKPDLVVAFPGGVGTMDMVMRAKAAGVRVVDASASPSPNAQKDHAA
jgi:hypothetical protein